MSLFITDKFKVIDTREDDMGNIYHFVIIRSLLLSIICEIGIKETQHKDQYYVNLISVHSNSDLKIILCSENFSYTPFSIDFIQKTAKRLLSDFITGKTKLKNSNLTSDEVNKLSGYLVDEIFSTDQKKIDDKVNIFY
ncbi:MAG TPA: hypothetical protein VK484_01450 [Ferruginibacter sp.]|nr:hypothetical protein [Ferruginibacter sp.]